MNNSIAVDKKLIVNGYLDRKETVQVFLTVLKEKY